MKISKLFLVATACVVLAAGCNRNAEPEATTPAVTAPDAAMTADAPTPVATEAPFVIKEFAGTFSADGNSISLNPDGTYTSKIGDVASDGTWNGDPMGTELLLDPNSKAEADSRYTVVSTNEISAIEGGMRLQREGAAR